MFRLDMTLEDVRIIAHSKKGEKYTVRMMDCRSGEEYVVIRVPAIRVSALNFLALAGEEQISPRLLKSLYSLVEPMLEKCPAKCRPIS